MHDNILQEMRKIEHQLEQDNRKLVALRLVLKEYATEDFPGNAKMNVIILECVNKHGGQATLQQIAACIDDHQIMLPRSKLSLLLTNNKALEYDKTEKLWKIAPDKCGIL